MSQTKPTARKIQFQPRFVQQQTTTMVAELKPKKFVGLLTPRATLKVNAAVFYNSEPQHVPLSARALTGGGQDTQDSSYTKQRQQSGMQYQRHRLLLKEKQSKQITQPVLQPQTQPPTSAQRNQDSQSSARHRLQAISNESGSQRNSSNDTNKQVGGGQFKVINKKLISFSDKKQPPTYQRTKQPLIHLGYRRQVVEAPIVDEELAATERQAPQLNQILYQQEQQLPLSLSTSRRQGLITTSSAKKTETSVSSATKRRPLIIRKNNFISETNTTEENDRSLNRTLKMSNLQNSVSKKLSSTSLQQSQSIKLVSRKNTLNQLSTSVKEEANDLPLSSAESVPVFDKGAEEISLKQLKDSKSTENQLQSASSLKKITMRGQIFRKQQKDSKENLLRTTNGMLFKDNSCQQFIQPTETNDQQQRGIFDKKNSDDQVQVASPESKPATRGEQSTTERTYCNSSVKENGNRNLGTVFSFKSQILQQQEIPQFPMKPLDTIRHYGKMLTEFERTEILEYPDVYFIGKQGISKIQGSPHLEFNFGYDDDQGDYKYIENDHIGYRYEVLNFLGKGSFGTALKCIDHKSGTEIALKVVKNKQKYVYQAGVELKILQFLKENDPEDIMNVVHLEDYVVFRKHLCISFELLSMNLFEFLKINDFNGFDHNLIRRFAIQLLYALKYLKMFQIIHCDLKPENIMLKENNKSGIKMIDFGSSTFQDERMYTYIQSRFYRAPEIMLGIPYDCGIDMWSFGCICAELYIGYPIFPGESEQDQMCRIMEMIGMPSNDVLAISERKSRFFKYNEGSRQLDPIMFKNSRGKLRKVNGKPLELLMGNEDPDFTDFVQKCLIMDPRKRMTPNKALKHVWVLKGLPPQVLIHHQKMHNIPTPELPPSVAKLRAHYIKEQEQMKTSRVPQISKDLQPKPQQQQLNSARNQKTELLINK